MIMDQNLKTKGQSCLKKHNVEIRRVTTKYKHTQTASVEAFNKELANLLFNPMNNQELQNPEKALAKM